MEQPYALALADRLRQLVITLETLISFPATTQASRRLDSGISRFYKEAIDSSAASGLLGLGDVDAIRCALSTWSEQSLLVREVVAAIIGDINSLRSDPVALEKATMLLSRRRPRT